MAAEQLTAEHEGWKVSVWSQPGRRRCYGYDLLGPDRQVYVSEARWRSAEAALAAGRADAQGCARLA